MTKIFKYSYLALIILSFNLRAQSFPPAAGQAGSTAISKDSSLIASWASAITVQRGYLDISSPNSGFASNGTDNNGLIAEGDITTIVSLGDSGVAVLTFENPIENGESWDFAIFENGFDDDYLELAHVEVSSDGLNFFRFPSTSEIQTSTQINAFAFTDCRLVNNLAGKYRAGFGTPFDLEELSNEIGLNINAITHVKIIDVVGSINPLHGTSDNSGTIINDGYPSNFPSGGFDLDGVAVLKHPVTGVDEYENSIIFYPNPAINFIELDEIFEEVSLIDFTGRVVQSKRDVSRVEFDVPSGIYQIRALKKGRVSYCRLMVVK